MNNLYPHLITFLKDGKIFLLGLIYIFSINTVSAQVATYDFENPGGQDGSQATNAAASSDGNITPSVMSKGSDLNYSSPWDYDGGFNAYDWDATVIGDIGPSNNDYYEFSVTVAAGFDMTLTSLVLSETHNDVDATGGSYSWTVRSSLDNYGSDIQTPISVPENAIVSGNNNGITSINNIITLTGGTFDNLTGSITFRIYAYSLFDTDTEWGIDDVVLNGSTADILAPTMQSATFDNVTTITVTFDENVQITANTPGDFTVVDGQGTAFTVTGLADNVASDDKVVLTVDDMSTAVGDMTVTYTDGTNEIEDFSSNVLATDGTGVIIDTDNSDPGLLSAAFDNVTTITVTFDEDVQITANTPGDFTVEDGQGTGFTVTGLADNVADDDKLVLTVDDMSAAVGDMTVTYTDGTNEIEDFGGNVLATDGTGVIIDTDSSAPGLLSAAFDNITTITVTFDEDVQITANTPGDFTVVDGQGTGFTVTGLTDNVADDDKVVLTVNDMSAAVGDMTVTYTDGTNEIEDFGGNALATDGTGVIIDTDSSAPGLSSVVKDDNTTITVTFDEDVKITANTPGDFTVEDALTTGFTVTGLADNVADDDKVVLTVNNMSTAVGDITVTYTDGTNEIEDFGGNALATDAVGVTISDNTPPSMQSASFDNVTTITVTFDESVQITANTPGDFTVVDGQGTGFTVTGLADNVASDDKLVLTVDDMSAAVGDITVTYNKTTSVIDDFGGNSLATDATGVTIDTDSSAPLMASASYDNATTITVTFNDDVQITVNTAGDFVVNDGQGTSFTVTVLADGTADDTDLVLTVDDMSAAVGDITVTYNKTTSVVDDFGSNSLATDATGVVINTDTSDPGLLSATQDSNTTITVTFDEDVQITSNTAGDFVVTDALAANFTVTVLADGSADDTDLVLTVNDMTTAVGDLTITYNKTTSVIDDFGGNSLPTDAAGVVIADITSPIADITYDDADGFVKAGQVLRITATFDEPVADAPVMELSLSGVNTQALIDMTKSTSTVYFYDHTVTAGDGLVTVALGTGTDIEGNGITTVPNSGATFTVDNDQPQADVTVDTDPIFTGDLIQNVTVTYDEDMDPTSTPSINVSGSAHMTAPAGSWISATEYQRTYTHNGTAEEVAAATFTVTAASGATDLAGNADLADASIPTFVIDTQRPTMNVAAYTSFSGNPDYVELSFSEPINLTNAASVDFVDDGGSVGLDLPNGDDLAVGTATYVLGTNTVDIYSAANNSKWDVTTSDVTYTTGGNLIDMNGNEIAGGETEVLVNGNTTPPVLSPDVMTLYPDGENPDIIVFTLDEELLAANGALVLGAFSSTSHPGTIASAVYSDKGFTNTITLTSTGNYSWTDVGPTIDITYTTGIGGDVSNLGGIEMATISDHAVVYETDAPSITTMTIASDNANPIWAKATEQITVTFVADDGLDYSNIVFTNVQSGGVALANPNPVISPATDVHNYAAVFTIDAGDTDGTFTFTLNYTDEAGNVGATLTNSNITSGNQVSVDNTKPDDAPKTELATVSDSGKPSAGAARLDDDITKFYQSLQFEDVSGTLETGTTIKVYSNQHGSTVLGSGVVDGSDNYSITLTEDLTQNVDHNITVTVTDPAGNVSANPSPVEDITIDTQEPQIINVELDAVHGGDNDHSHLDVYFDEPIDLPDEFNTVANWTASNGGVNYADYENPEQYVHLRSNTGFFYNASTTVDYDATSPVLFDIAGNAFPTTNNIGSIDSADPTVWSGITFSPDSGPGGAEQLIFRIDEEINIGEGLAATGFTVDDVDGISTAIYSSKALFNTITLTSPFDGAWSQDVTLSYSGAGNMLDMAGRPLGIITNEQVLLKNVIISSNNASPNTYAKQGDKIFLAFSTTSTLNGSPLVEIDGTNVAAVQTTGAPNYIYEITTDGLTTVGDIAFEIITEELDDGDSTNVRITTNASQIEFDKTAPIIDPMTIVSSNPINDSFAHIGDVVSLTITLDETIASGTATLAGEVNPTSSGGPLVFTFTHTMDGSEPTGTVTYSVTVGDAAGNEATYNATTDATSVTFDKTAPTVAITSTDADAVVKQGDDPTITVTFTDTNAIDETTPPTINIGGLVVSGTLIEDSNSNTIWDYSWTVPAGSDGNYAITVNATDVAGNTVGSYSGQTSFEIDNTPPTLTVTKNAVTNGTDGAVGFDSYTNDNSISYDIAFDRPINDGTFSIADITVNQSAKSAATFDALTGGSLVNDGDDQNYTLTISNTDVDGDLYITIGNSIDDIAGNSRTEGPTNSDNFIIDNTAPVMTADEISMNSSASPDYVFIPMSEDLILSNGASLTGFSTTPININPASSSYINSGVYNFIRIIGLTDGDITLTSLVNFTNPGNITDLAGNALANFSNHNIEEDLAATSPLSAGDIMFTGYNGEQATTDGFSFVLLKDIVTGTKIKFTDRGWSNVNGFTDYQNTLVNESVLTWVSTSDMYAGTEISVDSYNSTTSAGSVTGTLNLSATHGDQILGYLGSEVIPQFLSGIHMDYEVSNYNAITGWSDNTVDTYFDDERSELSSGLLGDFADPTNNNSMTFGNLLGAATDAQYDGSDPATTAAVLRTSMANPANWNNATSNYTLNSGDNYTLRPDITALYPTHNDDITVAELTGNILLTFNDTPITKETDIATYGTRNITVVKQGVGTVLTYGINDAKIVENANNTISLNIHADIIAQGDGTYEIHVDGFMFKNSEGLHNIPIDGNAEWTFVFDATQPFANSIVRVDTNPHDAGINAGSVGFTVEFNEHVNNVSIADFSLTTSSLIGTPAVTTVVDADNADSDADNTTGTTFTVTVSGFDLNDAAAIGSLNLNINGSATVNDDAGNNTTGVVAGLDETYDVINPAPAADVTSLTSSAQSTTTITLDWTNSATNQIAYQHLILVQETTASFSTPSDGTFVVNDFDLATGTVGQISINVGHGVNTYEIAGLNSATDYDFIIYPYTNDNSVGSYVDYSTNTPATVTETTATASDNSITFVSAAPTLSSLINAQGDVGVLAGNFVFNIQDDGGVMPDPDNAPTLINEIIIRQDAGNDDIVKWTEAILDAELSDGTTTVTSSSFDDTSITFTGITFGDEELGEIDDNEIKQYTLKIWLKSDLSGTLNLEQLIDGLNFVFDVDQADISVEATGSSLFSPAATANSGIANNAIDVQYSQLVFTTEPSTTGFTLTNLVTAGVVKALDANNNTDLNYNASTTAQISNTDGLTMSNIPATYTNGILTLTNLQFIEPGNATLTVNDINGIDADGITSNGIVISVDNQSDIIANTAFVYPTNIAYQNYREADINGDGSGDLEVAQFDIRDGGTGFIDQDGSATELTEITFGLTNFANIKNIALYNGAVELGEVAAAATVTFSSITASTPTDGGSLTLSLFVTFNDIVTDNDQFEFTITNTVTNSIRSSFAATDAGGAVSTTTTDENRIEVTATQLVFTQQPPVTANALVDVSPAPIVQAHDALNNVDLDFIEAIVSITNARVTPEIPMLNVPAGPFTLGELAFPANFQYTEPSFINGDGQLTVTTASFSIASDPVNVVVSELSDIIEDASYTYPTNFDYLPYDVETDLFQIAQYTLTDGGDGNGNDGDNADTELTSLTLNFANFSSIRQVAIYEGGTIRSDIKTLDASGNVTFNTGDVLPLSITASDNSTTSLNVRVNFNTTVIDNEQFTVEITGVDQNLLKSRFADPIAAGGAITTLGADDNKIEVVATAVEFTTQPDPTNVSTFTNIDNPYIVVKAQDINLNTDVDYNDTFDGITNNFAPVLVTQSDPTGNFTNGVYDFEIKAPTFQFTTDGLGGQLIISANGITDGTSSLFDVSASQESFITYISDGGNIPYVSFPPTGDLTDANSYAIAEFMLHDGNPALYGNDIDGASTVINGLTISLTNFINLDKVGIFDAAGTQYGTDQNADGTVTFTGVNFVATDDITNNFFIKASFKDNNTDITDAAVIDIEITNIVGGGGSKFEDIINNTGGEPDGGGGFNTAITPVGNNKINVVATRFVFTQQPSTIEGVNIAWAIDPSNPTIEARDANGNLDTGYIDNYTLTTPEAVLDQASVSAFASGIKDLSNLRYTSIGDGTLTIEDTAFPLATRSTTSNLVDVVNTALTKIDISDYPPLGNTNLNSADQDRAIIGFSLDANSTNPAIAPEFNNITINFSDELGTAKDTTDIFENIRLYKVINDGVLNPVIDIDYQLIGSSNSSTSLGSAVVIDGFTELLDLNADTKYVIITNISAAANETSGKIVANIIPNFQFLAPINGSLSGLTIAGDTLNFIDSKSPVISQTTPVYNDPRYIPDNLFTITFNEFVKQVNISNKNLFALREFTGELLISDSVEIIPSGTVDKSKSFDLKFYLPGGAQISLTPGKKYYITLQPNEFIDLSLAGNLNTSADPSVGILNNNEITNKGFWAFTKADTKPPTFQFTSSNTELVEFYYNTGFDLKLKFDEVGTAYALVLPTGSPTPVLADITSSTDNVAITQIDDNFYIHIRGLIANTAYDIYVAASDGLNESQFPANTSKISVQLIANESTLNNNTNNISIPSVEICVGELQDVNDPITIIEITDSDYSLGANSINLTIPDGYVFDTQSGTVFYFTGADITGQPILGFINSTTATIDFNTGGIGSQDEIRIEGLRIKANSNAANGNMIAVTNNNVGFEVIAANLIVTNKPEALFTLDPDATTINAQTSPNVFLEQVNPIDPFNSETYQFSGTGVANDSLFVQQVSLGRNTLFLIQTDMNGCQAFGSKEVNIIDNQIFDLAFVYCEDAASPAIVASIADPLNSFDGYNLESLVVNVNGIANPADISSNTFDPSTFIFNPNNAIPLSNDTSEFVSLNFVGLYRLRDNPNDSIPVTQRVNVYRFPNVTLTSEEDQGGTGIVEQCIDFGNIIFRGEPVSDGISAVGIYTLYDASNALITGQITGNADQSITINTDNLGTTVGVGTYRIDYSYANSVSTCVATTSMQLIINPKPVADFSILGKTTLDGCVDEIILFQNESDIITNSTFDWVFDDDNAGLGNKNDSTIIGGASPDHFYTSNGTFNVTLTATTDKGCMSDVVSNAIVIGNNPATSFDFRQIAVGTPTIFTSTTPSDANATLDSLAWTIDGVFAFGTNSAFSTGYEYPDFTADEHDVTLTAITDKNCIVSTSIKMFTVPKRTLNSTDADTNNDSRLDDFNDQGTIDNDGWIAWGKNSSWAIGETGGEVIIKGTDFAWNTGVEVKHNINEVSYVYSPVYNIANLDLPLLNLSKFSNLQPSNGVVIEYTAVDLQGNSSDGIDSTKWKVLGNDISGLNWYNSDAIDNVGGIQPNKRYGWTETDTVWTASKHTLIEAQTAASLANGGKGEIQLRISFVSGNIDSGFDGFAFDNVFVGSRNRIVLLENFTSSQQKQAISSTKTSTTKQENNSIFSLASSTPSLMAIQYHPDIDGKDPISTSPDANARALYYGLGESQRIAIDGVVETDKIYSEWGETKFTIRSLDISPLTITTTITPTDTESKIEISSVIDATTIGGIPKNYIVHTVIIENVVNAPTGVSIPSEESSFSNVVRKMLPSASGKKSKVALAYGFSDTVNNTWSPTKTYDFDELTVLVFVQDEMTREIYQANVQAFESNIVTSLGEELSTNGFAVWPNPANDIITLQVSQLVSKDTRVTVYDQLGKVVHITRINVGEDKVIIPSQDWIPGIYYIQAEFNGEPIQKRILVQHR